MTAEASADQRQRTMQVRALRRLSECEVAGLGIALDHLDQLEHTLVALLPGIRAGAEKEAAIRRAKGLPHDGPSVRAWSAVRTTLVVLADAREEVTHAEASGKVQRR